MKEKFQKAASWLFACCFVLLGIDGLTGGSLGVTKLMAILVAPIREELSLSVQIIAVPILAAVIFIPVLLNIAFVAALLRIKDGVALVITALISLWISYEAIFHTQTDPDIAAPKSECRPAGPGIYNDC